MDAETKVLADTLRERDRLRAVHGQVGAVLKHALAAWTETRPDYSRRGVTTEAAARRLLGQAGLL